MKILIIKQLFNPEPTAKSLDFAKELVARGHDVEVLTGFPSYPIGKFILDINNGFINEKKWKIDIIRVPIYPSHDYSGLKRFIHYFSYALTASFIGLFLIKSQMYVLHIRVLSPLLSLL